MRSGWQDLVVCHGLGRWIARNGVRLKRKGTVEEGFLHSFFVRVTIDCNVPAMKKFLQFNDAIC
ncbi:precorrin-2 dehydrogenase [Sporosarcina newyorkensis 2681]|uniref:Precorrin-2 dehydrogenase n=1 Tax=Sporosarcina newyorkensis 2681 TaxID=1027292 RepID=F9DTW8_9BACL|nr:precorrin-2 dehydrogenase [Sporosarcina newyorkensis 2681]